MGIKSDYDFSGWATRNDITCADGLTIRQDAFKDCDGKEVPLVYMHDHKDPENVLGHIFNFGNSESLSLPISSFIWTFVFLVCSFIWVVFL